MAKAAAASIAGSNTADVFSRRHTQSKVYWATGRSNAAAAAAAAKESQQQQLRRTASGATEVELLKGNLKKLDPSELIKVSYISQSHFVAGIICRLPPILYRHATLSVVIVVQVFNSFHSRACARPLFTLTSHSMHVCAVNKWVPK